MKLRSRICTENACLDETMKITHHAKHVTIIKICSCVFIRYKGVQKEWKKLGTHTKVGIGDVL